MPRFRYRAIDPSGEVISGEAEAESGHELMQRIEGRGNLPVDVDEIRESGGLWRWLSDRFPGGPTREEITELTQDLSMLLKGGVTLSAALRMLAEMSTKASVSRLMRELHEGLASGKSFAEVLAGQPRAFPRIYVKMVEVAEAAGTLEETLGAIAHERRRVEKLRRRITSALSYPAFLLVAALGVLVFVLVFVMPEFERALIGFEANLAPSAQMVFGLSNTLRENSDLFLAGGLAALLALLMLARSQRVGAAMLRLCARIPGLRNAVTYERTIFFCGTLSLLLRNGVDISTALRLIRELMRDQQSAEAIDTVLARVRQGGYLSDALSGQPLLPSYVLQMLRVGEEAGRLDVVAQRVAEFYEEKLDRALERLTGVLGPAIMILVSVLIAWVIISVITALLSVNELLA